MGSIENPVFLLGAGFNLDANALIPDSPTIDQPGRVIGLTHDSSWDWEQLPLLLKYPLVTDLVSACFGPDADLSDGAEALFSSAFAASDWVVLKRFVTILQGADHYLARKMTILQASPYLRFFKDFGSTKFMSYNYDSLAEIHLRSLGLWHPASGFGFEVEAYTNGFPGAPIRYKNDIASTIVLHLHGSLCVYPIEFDISAAEGHEGQWLTLRERLRCVFDADSLGLDFQPFVRPGLCHGYRTPEQRVIPPIINKAESLEAAYFRTIAQQACDLIDDAQTLVAIGYSFADSDAISYGPYLTQLFSRGKELVVVGPSAIKSVLRLKAKYPLHSSSISSLNLTFAQWVEAGYPKGRA